MRTLRAIEDQQRPATPDEQQVLARWSGWGAVPAALDPAKGEYAWVRDELAGLLDERQMAAARRTVINAHYTDAALVEVMWDAVTRLGFTGGRVLEPGCGSGNFLAFAPPNAELTGVELDPSTAAIAAALHPHADIRAESFADTRLRTGSVDLTIGNVPFGDVRLHDRLDNRGKHSIHNHFILKSLRGTRPGGLVAVITSAYTMDAANPAARREIQQMADLVGAVRLPSRAHARAAGTDALTDVLILRRREDFAAPAPFDWEYTDTVQVDGVNLRVNSHFIEQPQYVLGQFVAGRGLYRDDEVAVAGDPSAAPQHLRAALADVVAAAEHNGMRMTEAAGVAATRPAALLPRVSRLPDGYLRAEDDGSFSRLDDGQWEPYAPPKTQAGELRALLRIRDTAVSLLEAEAQSLDDTDQISDLRAELNNRYDAYASTYGPVNRFTEKPKRRKDPATNKMVPLLDEETGEPVMRRERPPQGGFRNDPFSPVVRALEKFDELAQKATKADIFTERVVSPRPPRLGADTADDALAISLDDKGAVDLPAIAWLLGVSEEDAREQLGTLVYDDPATGRLEPAAAYLSGDVKTKLAQARAAADDDDAYAVNVTALQEVVPRDLRPDEITIQMGAPWIGAELVQQFLREILDDPSVVVEYGGGAMWTVDSKNTHTMAATSTWGTDRRNALEIAQTILEQREFVITDTVGRNPKRKVVNLDAIMAATEKAGEMRERFTDWLWDDPQRAGELVDKYNDLFQRYVPRSYDGVKLSLPGLAMTFKPDPHQVAAVARIIHEPAVGLYHSVGAGKTADMIMGAMELRRLGLATKPVVVVPNQLLDQWLREFQNLYPQAKLLAAGADDLEGDRRRLLVARMATGDWDAVILTETAFEMLPMSPEAEQAYVDREMAELEDRIIEAQAAGQELTLKRLETKKANREQRLHERLDGDKDAGIWWQLTGIDYIFRDESHRDKNLRTVSTVPGMSIKGSQRAQQMDMKLGWLRERQPRWGTRATGTPIANSIVELYTEFRYLRPDLMENLGITDIDSFLATFAEGKVIIEVTPDGGGLKSKTRHEFVNVDELVTPMRVFADVKTKDDLNLQRPALAQRSDGQRLPEMVIVPPSEELLAKVAELVDRAANLRGKRPEKGADNILKIVGEGAAAALDLRLVGLSTDEIQKLDVAAERIAGYYRESASWEFLGPDGEPHPTPGALQMVFCDMGTPSAKDPTRWTAYGELRRKLVEQGVPREKIRFIHEASDDRERAELFAACRDGRVAVLISSTEKGGTGVNVQDRLYVLHHLDTPYRPCDLEQREGRADRRGNQNSEIRIERYATERSLDAFKWQKVAFKARQADLVLTGRAGRRTVDVGEVTMSYEEMKAATTGNPVLVEHAKAKADLVRLERLEHGFHRTQSQLRWRVTSNRQTIVVNQALVGEVNAAIDRRAQSHSDAFTATVYGTTYTAHGEANTQLKAVLQQVIGTARSRNSQGGDTIGEYGGFAIEARPQDVIRNEGDRVWLRAGVRVWLQDAPGCDVVVANDELAKSDVLTRLANRLNKLEDLRDRTTGEIGRLQQEIREAEDNLAKPFRRADELSAARSEFQHLEAQIAALAAASQRDTYAGDDDDDDDRVQDDDHDERRSSGLSDGAGRGTPAAAQTATAGRSGPGADTTTASPPAAPTSPGPADPAAGSAPDAAASPGLALQQLLAEYPQAGRDRLQQRLDQLAGDRQVVLTARAARDYDDFRPVIDSQLSDLMIDTFDEEGPDVELAQRYFNTDDGFTKQFDAAAGHYLYDRLRAAEPADAIHERDERATGTEAEPTPGTPAAAANSVHDTGPADDGPSGDVGLPETQRLRRGHDFYPPAALAATIPGLYGTEDQPPAEKILYLHYFGGSIDYWLAEYDADTGRGFGYGSLGDPQDAEWGYVDLTELEKVNAQRGLLIIERDLYWTPVPAGEANLPGHRAPQPVPAAAATADTAPAVSTGQAPTAHADSDSTAPAPVIHPGHPSDVVACTCCAPAGRDVAATPPDPGAPPRHGRFEYTRRAPIGLSAGKRWLKVVALHAEEGRPTEALAFVDPATDEWYAPAGWRAPNKKSTLSDADRDWLVARLPYLTSAAPAGEARRSGPEPSEGIAAVPAIPAGPHATPAGSPSDLQPVPAPAETQADTAGDAPAVHVFSSTEEAYGATQTRNDIRDGDVLSVPAEQVAGFLYEAWPAAVTTQRGDFHGADLDALAGRYAASIAAAREVASEFPDPAPTAEPVNAEPARDDLGAAHQPLTATENETASAEATTPQHEPVSAAAAPVAAPALWTSRIHVTRGANLTVTGTTGAPREDGLRALLKQHRFRFRDGTWSYGGRRGSDRESAATAIDQWLAEQTRVEQDRAAAATARPARTFTPTAEQQRIIDAYLAGQTVVVQALAGTGKTSTLLALADLQPERRIAYIAFNRSIADEAQGKFGRNVRADTSHAFAREGIAGTPLAGKLSKVNKGARWPEDWARTLGITGAVVDGNPIEPESIARLVMGTVRVFRESADPAITAAHLPRNMPEGLLPLSAAVVAYATRAWQDIVDPAGQLLFDHDDYLKAWALTNPRLPYDAIFFDEAQDINAVLRKIIQDQPVQTVVVGDSNQSIYGFRGALDALKDWPADVTLPLTQSWRFGAGVADVGNQFLKTLKSPWLLTGNPALQTSIGVVEQPDAVLARTNAGAVAAVFDAFDAGRKVALVGGARTIEEIAKAARDLQAGRGTKHPELSRFADWDAVREYVEDDEHAQSLRAFVRLVDRRGADQLIDMARGLVDEHVTGPDGTPGYDVIVSTAHKAKGREWEHVRLAEDFPQPKEDLVSGQVQLPPAEELRLAYVSVTRAKQRLELGSLSWINDPSAASALSARASAASVRHAPAPQLPPVPELPADPPSVSEQHVGAVDGQGQQDETRRPAADPPAAEQATPLATDAARSDGETNHTVEPHAEVGTTYPDRSVPVVAESVDIDGTMVDIVRYPLVRPVDNGVEFDLSDQFYAIVQGAETSLLGARGRSAATSSMVRTVDRANELGSGKDVRSAIASARRKLERQAAYAEHADTAKQVISSRSPEEFQALPADADIQPGDIVSIYSYQQHRDAVAVKVTGTKIEALVATPSSPEWAVGARGTRGTDVRLVRPSSQAATVDDRAPVNDPSHLVEHPAPDSPPDLFSVTTSDADQQSGGRRRDGHDPDTTRGGAYAPADGALARLDPLDRERVRIAVEDNAGRINRVPHMSGAGNVARYVAEGRDLRGLPDTTPLGHTIAAVRQIIDQRPDLLDRSDADIEAGKAARRSECDSLAQEAYELVKANDRVGALAALDRGEHLDPGYRLPDGGPGMTWEEARDVVRENTSEAPPAGSAASPVDVDAIRTGDIERHDDAAPTVVADHHDDASPFTDLELAMIRNAVADHAEGSDDGDLTAVADRVGGHLQPVIEQHGVGRVTAAIGQAIAADPDVLARSTQERSSAQYARHRLAEGHAYDAMAAFKQGDVAAAMRSLEQGELVDPTYRPGRRDRLPYGVAWDELRQLVSGTRPAADAGVPPGTTPGRASRAGQAFGVRVGGIQPPAAAAPALNAAGCGRQAFPVPPRAATAGLPLGTASTPPPIAPASTRRSR